MIIVFDSVAFRDFLNYRIHHNKICLFQKATSDSSSMRTTIPKWLCKQFGLGIGDSLYWKLEAVGGSLKIVVEPVKK